MGTLATLLIETAQAQGFPVAGVVDILKALEGFFQTDVKRYDHWLRAGFAGEMEYLKRGRDRRSDPRLVFSDAKSMLCVAIPYSREPTGAAQLIDGPRYARYLRGRDYHKEIAERLEEVMKTVAANWSADPPLKWKICVDTSAILERSWAALAGLGWIGKNTLLIHPKLGSYLFLAEVLINQETGRAPAPLPDYCGNCEKCLHACPTQALVEAHSLDSNRCISYSTLEKRGAPALSGEMLAKTGGWIAGCDLCQEVCPFNQKPSRAEPVPFDKKLDATGLSDWRGLLAESEDAYRSRVSQSSLSRVKPGQFRRNLAIALSNALESLTSVQKFKLGFELGPLIKARWDQETDPDAKLEWQRCLQMAADCSQEEVPKRTP